MGRANGPHACSLVTFPSPSAWPLRGVYGSRCGGRIEYSQLTGGCGDRGYVCWLRIRLAQQKLARNKRDGRMRRQVAAAARIAGSVR